ncbi:MAG: molybdopterin molybdotransferase MoeA [Helicobacter sp.]|nr:molybdopterin molybdotransferase MoeA [Helicobacter sp.]
MKEKIDFGEALGILQSQKITPMPTQRVFLYEALGRVLSQDIFAPNAMPEVALCNMDGYALSSSEIAASGGIFEIVATSPAGSQTPMLPKGKKAIKVFTGASFPKNADTLVPIERVKLKGDKILIEDFPPKGEFVRQKGANYKKGEKLLSKGTLLKSSHIGLLASLNQVFIEVFEKPKVGILVSGNEILELGDIPKKGAIYNANGHLLYAKVLESGGIPKLYEILKDKKEEVNLALQRALKECDMVITSGGASVGDYDFIAKIMQKKSKEILFKGVKIKPGQHIGYARLEGKEFFILPGFPNSTLVTFELFVKEILAKLCGYTFKHTIAQITLQEDLSKKDSRVEFRVCNVKNKEGIMQLDFEGKKDFLSAILNNFCPLGNEGVGLVILEKNSYKKGERVKVILL